MPARELTAAAAFAVLAACGAPSTDRDASRDDTPARDAPAPPSDAPLSALDAPALDATPPPDAPAADTPAAADAGADAGPPFDTLVFRATHNSYSGGARGAILRQLDRGVRFVEFDVHDNDYDTAGYQIGHFAPGGEVDHAGGNPASNRLRDWLAQVAAWSSAHPRHAPLTVALDLKDDLTDNASFREGNLAALNALVRETFGARLFARDELAAASERWPGLEALRGRVIAVYSGDRGTREAYRFDRGANPAVAMNDRGQVVEVHDSGDGALWYWTGEYVAATGAVRWHRHGRYDTGQTPAVAINRDGWIVEVHRAPSSARLWYHVGRLGADYEIAWSPSVDYDDGILPTVRFTDAAGLAVREVHRSESRDQNWFWNGRLDAGAMRVAWDAATHATTSDPRYDVRSATAASGRRVAVSLGADGAAPADTLRYATDRMGETRIRYEQVAFAEYQMGDGTVLREGAWFYAASAGEGTWLADARRAGRLVRGWGFNEARQATDPLVTFPATDTPDASWYEMLLTRAGAAE